MKNGHRERRQEESENDGQVSGTSHLSVRLRQLLYGDQLRHDAPFDRSEESGLCRQQEEDAEHAPCLSGEQRGDGQKKQEQLSPFNDDKEVAFAVAVRQCTGPIRKKDEGND